MHCEISPLKGLLPLETLIVARNAILSHHKFHAVTHTGDQTIYADLSTIMAKLISRHGGTLGQRYSCVQRLFAEYQSRFAKIVKTLWRGSLSRMPHDLFRGSFAQFILALIEKREIPADRLVF